MSLKSNIERHAAICNELHNLYFKKNTDYGDSFHLLYLQEGIAASRIRLGDKYNRFVTLTRNGGKAQVKDESIRDTLMDMAEYAIMTIMEMDRARAEVRNDKMDRARAEVRNDKMDRAKAETSDCEMDRAKGMVDDSDLQGDLGTEGRFREITGEDIATANNVVNYITNNYLPDKLSALLGSRIALSKLEDQDDKEGLEVDLVREDPEEQRARETMRESVRRHRELALRRIVEAKDGDSKLWLGSERLLGTAGDSTHE